MLILTGVWGEGGLYKQVCDSGDWGVCGQFVGREGEKEREREREREGGEGKAEGRRGGGGRGEGGEGTVGIRGQFMFSF